MMAKRWKRLVEICKDIGEVAKLFALLLAILGFIGLYFPTVKLMWEKHFSPRSWYQIGKIQNGMFLPNAYQNPKWNGSGPFNESVFSSFGDEVIVTENDEPHIGRKSPGANGLVQSVIGKNVCLYAFEVKNLSQTGDSNKYVWAYAAKISW